jgi:cell division protein FtsN
LQDQLKERLTGAAILVVVVVLAVPAMFRGHPDAAAAADDPVGSATPLHTYTLVDDGPAAQPPPQAALQPEPQAPSLPLSQPQQQQQEQPQQQPPQQPPAQVLPQQAAPQQAQAAPQQTAPQQTAPQQTTPTPEPVPAARRPADAKPARAAASKGGWAVQVGSFHVRELADRMSREVTGKGFKVHVVGPDERGLYRVRSALQADKEAALALRQQMVARGLKPIVNASP